MFFLPLKRINSAALFLSRFVSDYGPAGCQALLQHRLIQANQKTQLSSGSTPETARTYPLSLLEWTANRKKANMVLHVHCVDGEIQLALSLTLHYARLTSCSSWGLIPEQITNIHKMYLIFSLYIKFYNISLNLLSNEQRKTKGEFNKVNIIDIRGHRKFK